MQVVLSASTKSTLLTLTNESSEPLRFQIRVYAWNQSPSGEMELAPTDDIVLFPTLVTLAAGKQRKVRIGAATEFGGSEKSYRVFFEELPPADGELAAARSEVRILTKMGIPIFLQPAKPTSAGAIDSLAFDAGHLRFLVRNDGNAHFVLRAVRVQGVDAAGAHVFDRALEGWYVLPGGAREFDLAIPAEICPLVRGITVESETERNTFKAVLDARPEGCGALDALLPRSN